MRGQVLNFYLSNNPADARVMQSEGCSEFVLCVIPAGVGSANRCVPAAFITSVGNILYLRSSHCATLLARIFHTGFERLQKCITAKTQNASIQDLTPLF